MVKLNVLWVTGVFPPGVGGMQSYYEHLCRYSHHNVTVLAPCYEGDASFDAQQTFRIIREPFLVNDKLKVFNLLRLYGIVKRMIIQESTQLTAYGYILLGLIGYLLNRGYGHRYVVSVHGMDLLKLARIPVVRGIVKKIFKRSVGIIANSAYTKSILIDFGVESEKIDVVYPGVAKEFERRKKNEAFVTRHQLAGKYVLLSLGRIVERKGVDQVIRAMVQIRQSIPDAIYLIVGTGPYLPELRRLAEVLGVSDQVQFVGLVENHDMVDYYNLCDVFIMPSRYIANKGDVEGFGIVFLEAGSCGKPVIGGNSGGVVEAVLHEETGLIVDPLSTEQIAAAVNKLYLDRELADRLAQHGYVRAKTMFQYEQIAHGFDTCIATRVMDA